MISNKNMLSEIQAELIYCLDFNGQMTRSEIVEYTDIPRSTIYDNISILIKMKLVKKFPRNSRKKGRPAVYFKLIKRLFSE